ncbi:5-(carboxyamino)imidazole ribonucleotide mutase [Tropheryma whipplei]|uniref:N5-carboxyaminoimidazole ribonucleotide mutase n=1 Tax=Tropheryma whipplei (strain Twist) TaxID=203267 RepID=Q83H35_TROWT|nr:5-(carboxyamino)imidazole ribonucleotide mutase [Tropheryma whipplei]AAO44124.1 phosphoribosylaminoimidazole carboxylase catalytic subunit [Tropheryma whipplei str. Twist]CAD66721.1 phosphoribosylaminoimidazole carboxylase catalytic subunit PurE [Tropheryma whipplei TW08/27]
MTGKNINDEGSKCPALVWLLMGSDSDWPVMSGAADILQQMNISFRVNVVSAHRQPEKMISCAKRARDMGFKVLIAAAGGAAHLPGMLASVTTLPVIGVPVGQKNLSGLDSLLSIVQMPSGVPVACVGIDSAKNAALLAARILGVQSADIEASRIADSLSAYQQSLFDQSNEKDRMINEPK